MIVNIVIIVTISANHSSSVHKLHEGKASAMWYVACVVLCLSVNQHVSYPKLLNMILYIWALCAYLIWIILVHRGVLYWIDWLF